MTLEQQNAETVVRMGKEIEKLEIDIEEAVEMLDVHYKAGRSLREEEFKQLQADLEKQPKHVDWDIKEWPYQTHLRAKTKAEHLEQIRCLFGEELKGGET